MDDNGDQVSFITATMRVVIGGMAVAIFGLFLKIESDIATVQAQQSEHTRQDDQIRIEIMRISELENGQIASIAELRVITGRLEEQYNVGHRERVDADIALNQRLDALTERVNKLSGDGHR